MPCVCAPLRFGVLTTKLASLQQHPSRAPHPTDLSFSFCGSLYLLFNDKNPSRSQNEGRTFKAMLDVSVVQFGENKRLQYPCAARGGQQGPLRLPAGGLPLPRVHFQQSVSWILKLDPSLVITGVSSAVVWGLCGL